MSYDMGIMMPKAIIVAREEGKTVLRHLTMKPWEVSMMFPDIDIAPMAKSVAAIMEEITSETIRKAKKRAAES
jgi:DNA-directed RNA polymerase subunit H (RpoH/RPB5)